MRVLSLIVGIAIGLVATAPLANSFSTNFTDIWWNASESGQGYNVIHQDNTLFVTFFVYGTNNQAGWFVGSDIRFASSAGGTITFSGDLYQTTGPFYGGPFNPNAVTNRRVGAVTIAFPQVSSGQINYTVDGTAVAKSITRYTFKNNNTSGQYIGGLIGTYSACVNPLNNGYSEEAGVMSVTHNANSIAISMAQTSASCAFTGTYVQEGSMGRMNGTYSCTNGVTGTWAAVEVDANISGLTARVTASSNACNFSGRFGGLRRGA